MEPSLLSIEVFRTDSSDPQQILVTINKPYEAKESSRLPYDEAVAMPAILKALEATSFNRNDYEDDELEWLRQNHLVTGATGCLSYSPKLRESVGESLFDCLFPTEKMRSIYDQVRRGSSRHEIHFQLCFGAEAPLVGACPWELLHHDGDFLIVGGKGTLTRYISFASAPPFREPPSALSVLLVAPRPLDPQLSPLDSSEVGAIHCAMEGVKENFTLHPQVVSSFQDLEDYLSRHCGDDAPDIIHFDGHGTFGRRCVKCHTITTKRSVDRCTNCSHSLDGLTPQGYLVFEDAQGRTDYRSADEFSDLVRQTLVSVNREARGGTRLIVLSACRSAVARGTEQVFNGVSQRLIEAGVPAVVAMQFTIRADAAERFASRLYQQIAARAPLVTAMSWGRTVLGGAGDQWYRPVLYLRWRDNEGGKLFGVANSSTALDGLTVRTGLDALTDLLTAHPDTHRDVASFCAGCQASCENLALAGDYKAIHDLLHELQFRCYNSLEQDTPRFPDDDLAVDNIHAYKLNLERIIDDMRSVFDRGLLPIGKAAMVQSLEQADTKLSTAIETRDTKELVDALWHMNRVLTVQPFLINQSLKDAVTAARLPALVEKLLRVSSYLDRLGLDTEKLLQFQDGLQRLDQLSRSLTTLVIDHDLWQDLDFELRRVENSIRQDVLELMMSWSDVEAKAMKVLGENDAAWAVNLRKYQALLVQALADGDKQTAKRQFKLFRRQAAERFYQVDADLKKRCDGLAMIGTSLTDTMRLVQ